MAKKPDVTPTCLNFDTEDEVKDLEKEALEANIGWEIEERDLLMMVLERMTFKTKSSPLHKTSAFLTY